jgi:uncharacterized repeat protein (TIGR03837 family)
VVDNYGDIGVCWRLARELAARFGVKVRIWVDDWAALTRLCPQATHDGAFIAGVELRRWTEAFAPTGVGEVVIEAFACKLPEAQVEAMAAQLATPPLWINLEYLSAEDWVRECHGLASPQSGRALGKYFFFPGFGPGTGGLIRESGLFRRRAQALRAPRSAWLHSRGIKDPGPAARWVSLFAYGQRALGELLQCWSQDTQPTLLLVPEGRMLADVGAFFATDLAAGCQLSRGVLHLAVLPFSAQDAYDELLWHCDLNLVRGEDSFVRAQWAARPMVWQIYPQDEGAHGKKLDAFLALYTQGLEAAAAAALKNFWHGWNDEGQGGLADAWGKFALALPTLTLHAQKWCDHLNEQDDLVHNLDKFCTLRKISG